MCRGHRSWRAEAQQKGRSEGVTCRLVRGPRSHPSNGAVGTIASQLGSWTRGPKQKPERRPEDDATEYVAKLGLSYDDCVIVMNRAHDRVLVPPPARAALAAFALAGQSFGFTHEDVAIVGRAAELLARNETGTALRSLADRLAALLPPAAA